MNKYQLLFIIENGIEESAKDGLVEKFSTLIEKLSGNVATVDKWGTKRYAYAIDYKTEGYYVLINFELAATAVAELDRQLRINENVVRHLITKVE